jgi:tRNA (adenine37-N6)-methyltransferase
LAQIPSAEPQNTFSFHPIGWLESCFKEKFGIPRQPGLVKEAWAVLHLPKTEAMREALHGLDSFSHLWLIFIFDRCYEKPWSPRVRPPRLGGDRSMGVFASRAPFRPNPLGMSVVEYKGLDSDDEHWLLKLGGCDLVDGTPILDIKPYLPYVDGVVGASEGWTSEAWPELQVSFSEQALTTIHSIGDDGMRLQALISSCLRQDPRPAYKRGKAEVQEYGFKLEQWNIKFIVRESLATVLELELASAS